VPTRPHTLRLLACLVLLAPACGPASTGGDGPARRLQAVSAARQTGLVQALVTSQPAVRVTDASGHPKQGITVDFAVTAGGGEVDPASGVSGADGIVTTAWRLGAAGAQELVATSPQLADARAVFTAQAYPTAGYHIDLQFLTSASDAQWQAFTDAADRISQVVVGGTAPVSLDGRSCDGTRLAGTVDDLLILVRLTSIDGKGGVLGQAGPCVIRSSGLPAVGLMEFDVADLAQLEASGLLRSTILHEMLHVVGFGTMWNGLGLLSGAGSTTSAFTGAQALAAFTGDNGGPPSATGVPVENCVGVTSACGAGTRDSHWREAVFKNELMTGWLSGSSQPLSRTTVGSLADLGYAVDLSAADAFDLATAALHGEDASELQRSAGVSMGDDVLDLPIQLVP
jgi:hypothetical protein